MLGHRKFLALLATLVVGVGVAPSSASASDAGLLAIVDRDAQGLISAYTQASKAVDRLNARLDSPTRLRTAIKRLTTLRKRATKTRSALRAEAPEDATVRVGRSRLVRGLGEVSDGTVRMVRGLKRFDVPSSKLPRTAAGLRKLVNKSMNDLKVGQRRMNTGAERIIAVLELIPPIPTD